MKKGLRRAAWGSLGWGIFTTALSLLAVSGGSRHVLTYINLFVGLVLLVEGIWLFRSPEPTAVIAEGAVLALLGLWNTAGLYLDFKFGIKPVFGGHILIVGVLQLITAYETLKSYPSWKSIYPIATQDPASSAELSHVSDSIWSTKPANDPDLIEFKAGNKPWKVKFLPEYAVMVTNKGNRFLVVEKNKLRIETTGETMLSKNLKIKIALDDEELKSALKPEYFDRYQRWTGAAMAASSSS
jgi:hypothetical protein